MKKNIKLFNISNDKNIKLLLNNIKKDFLKKDKADEIFFDKVSYKEFYKSIKTKYGVDINKYQQVYNIFRYTKSNDLQLNLPKKNYIYNYDKSYTGWYYSSGYIDKICANGIRLLLKDKFDGFIKRSGFYTPYMKNTITQTEFILWNEENILERLPKDKYDSMQFIKHLHFNPSNINFDTKLSTKNDNFRMINFYLNNKINNNEINNINKLTINKNQLKIMSLNVHNFKSINLNDQPSFILNTLLYLLDQMNIDLCFLQEYYTNLEIKSEKYNYIKNNDHIGIVVLYKNNLNVKNINSFKLINEKYFDQRRFCLHFEINNKKFAVTHLEIGKRFYDRSGNIHHPDELFNIINFNYELRKNQLNQILDQVPNPDFIIGDFNFNNLDKEFDYITKQYYTGLVNSTTPFEKQVDFIFSKKTYNFFTKIKYPYSDHLPVIAIIDT